MKAFGLFCLYIREVPKIIIDTERGARDKKKDTATVLALIFSPCFSRIVLVDLVVNTERGAGDKKPPLVWWRSCMRQTPLPARTVQTIVRRGGGCLLLSRWCALLFAPACALEDSVSTKDAGNLS